MYLSAGPIVYIIESLLASVVSIITILNRYVFLNSKRQLSEYDKFTDRYEQLKSIVELIYANKKIINIYGKKGVGKSYFLKYFSDFINGKIPKKHRKNKRLNEIINLKTRLKIKVIYYELSEYTKEDEILSTFMLSCTNKNINNPESAIKKLLNRLFLYKKIIIIFDNVTNECSENAVENIIAKISPMSKKLVFVLGSIERLILPKSGINKAEIEILEFSRDEIKEYSENCKINLSSNDINNILSISDGLPIMVDLMISNKDYLNHELYDKYVYNLFKNIEKKNAEMAKLVMYIALLSLVNSEVAITQIKDVDSTIAVSRSLLNKLHMLSIIKYNESKKSIKMHDIIRDCIISEFSQNQYYQLLKNVNSFYFKINDIYNGSVYSILLKKDDFDSQSENLEECIKTSILEENYTYLIALGNHYFRCFNLQNKNNLYYRIAYGYILALLSVGDYPTAKKFSDEESLSISDCIKYNQIEIAIKIADLFHLQSEYDFAVESYFSIINRIKRLDDKEIDKHIMTCNMKIAHSYRHMGNYNAALSYYFSALDIANKINDLTMVITINLELSIIYISNPSYLKSEYRYKNVMDLFKDTLSLLKKSDNKVAQLLYYRNYARLQISELHYNYIPDEIEEKLKLAQEGYEKLKKRLIYTMHFEFGEIYRIKRNISGSLASYENAIFFSKKNGDKNLETMSYLGIILLELDIEKFIYNKNKQAQKNLLVDVIDIAKEHNLSVNKLLAELLLSYLQDGFFTKEQIVYIEKRGLEKTATVLSKDSFQFREIQLFMM